MHKQPSNQKDKLQKAQALEDKRVEFDAKRELFLAVDRQASLTIDPAYKGTLVKHSDKFYSELKKIYREYEELLANCSESERKDELKKLEIPERKLKNRIKTCAFCLIFATSFIVTASVISMRFFRVLQSSELWFYDSLIRTESNSDNDDKVLVIEIRDEDIDKQKRDKEEVIGSLSNKTLLALLEKITQLDPIAVGLDMYRDDVPLDLKELEKIDKKLGDLEQRNRQEKQALQQNPDDYDSKVFTICKTSSDSIEVAPPTYADEKRIGFSDFVLDSDGTLRRYNLAYDISEANDKVKNSKCNTNFSFAFSLANHYLSLTQKDIKLEEFTSKNEYCFSPAFPTFLSFTGGYQRLENNTKCQILINYQRKELVKYGSEEASNNDRPVQAVTVKDFLDSDFLIEDYKERIVLIGSAAHHTTKDYWYTPYSSSFGENTPGVEIHAQVIIQILNAILSDSRSRASIWVLHQWQGEWIVIGIAALVGGLLVGGVKIGKLKVIQFVLPVEFLSVMIFIPLVAGLICFLVFQFMGGWLPFVPLTLAFWGTGGSMRLWIWLRDRSLSASTSNQT